MNFENTQNNLILEQEQNNYELENNESELQFNNEEPQATFEDVSNKLSFEAPNTNLDMNYNNASNKPQINGVELIGNKTTEDLGIVGTSMTEIEVSTNPEEPTDISQYFEKSGTYVAKNTGILDFEGIATPIAKGGFFTVQNFKDDASKFGVEVPDEYNVLMVSLFVYNGEIAEEVLLKRIGLDEWSAGIKITSANASDYLDLDIDVTSEVQEVLKSSVSATYGMQLMSGGYLSFISASNYEIDSASTPYRAITPSNIKYAIQKWGASYYPTKEEHQTLSTNLTTLETSVNALKTEIETILDSVVVVDE